MKRYINIIEILTIAFFIIITSHYCIFAGGQNQFEKRIDKLLNNVNVIMELPQIINDYNILVKKVHGYNFPDWLNISKTNYAVIKDKYDTYEKDFRNTLKNDTEKYEIIVDRFLLFYGVLKHYTKFFFFSESNPLDKNELHKIYSEFLDNFSKFKISYDRSLRYDDYQALDQSAVDSIKYIYKKLKRIPFIDEKLTRYDYNVGVYPRSCTNFSIEELVLDCAAHTVKWVFGLSPFTHTIFYIYYKNKGKSKPFLIKIKDISNSELPTYRRLPNFKINANAEHYFPNFYNNAKIVLKLGYGKDKTYVDILIFKNNAEAKIANKEFCERTKLDHTEHPGNCAMIANWWKTGNQNYYSYSIRWQPIIVIINPMPTIWERWDSESKKAAINFCNWYYEK